MPEPRPRNGFRPVGAADPFEMPSYRPEPWTENAACRPDHYPSVRKPNGQLTLLEPNDWHQAAHSPRTRLALVVCVDCPVRTACLEYAVRKRIDTGIWGGVTEGKLRSLIRAAYQRKARSMVVIRPRQARLPAS